MFLVQRTLFVIWMCMLVVTGFRRNSQCPTNKRGILVYSTGTEIRKINLRSRKNEAFVKNSMYRSVGVAVSGDSKQIYWSNINSHAKAIMRSALDGRHTEVIADTGLEAPEKLAVDWVTGNVYFVDTGTKQIGVCTKNGIYCTVLLNSSVLDRPGGLVLNPKDGEMFWSDYGKRPAIWRAGMDGKGARIMVIVNDGWPKGLAIDYLRNRLYWINSKVDGIERMSLFENQSAEQYLHLEGKKLRSLAIFDNKLYWSDWSANTIESHDISMVRDNTFIVNASALIYDMDIYHPSLKPPLPNSCMGQNCQELCLLAPTSRYTCACKVGRVLSSDLHSCRPNIRVSHLAITAGDRVLYYHEEALGQDRIRQVFMPMRMSRINYDRKSRNFISDDQFTDALYRLDTVTQEVRLLTAPVYSRYLGGIDINHRTNITSWTVANIRRIDQINLYNGARINYTFEDVPLDILSIPKRVKNLVVFKSDTTGLRIDWLILGEPQRAVTMIPNLIGPKISLSYDRNSGRVYFADEGIGNIESFVINFNCSHLHTRCDIDRQLVISSVEKPVSLTISNRKLYWTSRHSNVLQWLNLDDEYRNIKSKILPVNNTVEIMDVVVINFE